jgi:hypothetical protein
MKSIYVGIDLAIAKNKLLPICFCQWEGKCLIPLPTRSLRLEPPRGNGNLAVLDERLITQFVEEAAAYISAVTRELGGSVERIGIDAPRTPRADQSARRKAEVAMDVAGISCYPHFQIARITTFSRRCPHQLAALARTAPVRLAMEATTSPAR